MYTHFKNSVRGIVILVMAMTMMSAVNAQRIVVASVNTIMLGPPYNVPFDQLKDKIRVTVLSNASLEGVYLNMMIRGDNGIVIQTNGNQVEQFYVGSGVPLMIPNSDQNFDVIFQQQNLSFSNIDPTSLYNYGLPPGHYQICFQLWNPFRNCRAGSCFTCSTCGLCRFQYSTDRAEHQHSGKASL